MGVCCVFVLFFCIVGCVRVCFVCVVFCVSGFPFAGDPKP